MKHMHNLFNMMIFFTKILCKHVTGLKMYTIKQIYFKGTPHKDFLFLSLKTRSHRC